MLAANQHPLHAAGMTQTLQKFPGTWQKRPLPQPALDFAAEAVLQLPELARRQKELLGAVSLPSVRHLSAVNAEWLYEEADRTFTKQAAGSQAEQVPEAE